MSSGQTFVSTTVEVIKRYHLTIADVWWVVGIQLCHDIRHLPPVVLKHSGGNVYAVTLLVLFELSYSVRQLCGWNMAHVS